MARPPKEATVLDMPFGEALERFVGTKMSEVRANIRKAKKRKPRKKRRKAKR